MGPEEPDCFYISCSVSFMNVRTEGLFSNYDRKLFS